MDQRSEREVHNQLVASTSQADAGQFFLLTPKLLTGLDYHPKMRVLIICNGEWGKQASLCSASSPFSFFLFFFFLMLFSSYSLLAWWLLLLP